MSTNIFTSIDRDMYRYIHHSFIQKLFTQIFSLLTNDALLMNFTLYNCTYVNLNERKANYNIIIINQKQKNQFCSR